MSVMAIRDVFQKQVDDRRLQVAATQPAAPASLSQVEDFAATMKSSFLQCRDLGHAWKPYSAGSHRDGGFERKHRCRSCGGFRTQRLSAMGRIISNSYDHPDGYLSPIGRIDGDGRGLLRLEVLSREKNLLDLDAED